MGILAGAAVVSAGVLALREHNLIMEFNTGYRVGYRAGRRAQRRSGRERRGSLSEAPLRVVASQHPGP